MTYRIPSDCPNLFCSAAQSCAAFNSLFTSARTFGATGSSAGALAYSCNLALTLASSDLNSSSAAFMSASKLVELVKSFSIVRLG